jgi:hypothetical protein
MRLEQRMAVLESIGGNAAMAELARRHPNMAAEPTAVADQIDDDP